VLSNRLLDTAVTLAAVVVFGAAIASSARAGCGCDHPPPGYATVMPAFASPGKIIRINTEDADFKPGAAHLVDFGRGVTAKTLAMSSDYLEVEVPNRVMPGPVALRVLGPNLNKVYSESLFTALPMPAPIEEGTRAVLVRDYPVAVTADGTLLIPIDMSRVQAPMQLAFEFQNLPLAFGHEGVVFYNTDGVDLTLFTLVVADPTERQWGSYYGWTVEEDTGLTGDVYESKVIGSMSTRSDILTYWRHEFYTYAQAHAPGGTHELDEYGFHPDGTLHVDHDHLVIALSGMLRDPADPTVMKPLEPGVVSVDVLAASVLTPNPLELDMVISGLMALDSMAEVQVYGAEK
jgi:hypothetical protein